MAVITQSAFAPDACLTVSAGSISTRTALPGTLIGDSTVRIINTGPDVIAVQLGDNTVVASPNTSLLITPGSTQYLALGAATYIAAVSIGTKAILNVCTGN